MIIKKLQNNKGYTLLFAVLVSAIVLSVGISILNISKKEYLLATSARDSSTAFYVADSGIECFAYHDLQKGFSTSTQNTLNCGNSSGITFSFTEEVLTNGAKQYTAESIPFRMSDQLSCANVTITKTELNNTWSSDILSRGYNIGWDENLNTCSKPNAKRVERAIRLNY